MGDGSRHFFYHYAVFTFLYSVIAFVLLGEASVYQGVCTQKCPLLISNATSNPYASCLCFGDNYNNSHESTAVLQEYALGFGPGNGGNIRDENVRYNQVEDVNNGISPRKCYICGAIDKADIYEPCDSFSECEKEGLKGFRPARNVDAHCRLPPYPEASILTTPAVHNRFLIYPLSLGISVLYLLIGLCCLFCAIGYYIFRNKYLDDWSKLTRSERIFSYICKIAPIIAHLCNFIALILIIVFDILIFGVRVCETATDEFGEPTFFRHVIGLAVACSVLWLVGTIFGTCVNKHMARDTSFYNPKHGKSEATCCYRIGACAINATIKIGP